MSFDLPANLERDLESYARAERITPAEAAAKFIQSGLRTSRVRQHARAALSEAELKYLNEAFPALDAFADVSDEEWKRVEEGVGKLKRTGLSTRG